VLGRITTQQQALAAGPGVYRVSDERGLRLRKTANTSGAWFFRYRLAGQRRDMGLGALRDVPLSEAKKMAARARLERQEGHDPIELRRQRRCDNLVASRHTITFKEANAAYVRAHAPKWKERHADRRWLSRIERYALPVIGALFLNEITSEHVAEIMRRTGDRRVIGQRLRAQIAGVLAAAIATGKRDARLGNPADASKLAAILPQRAVGPQHHARLELDEAPAAFAALQKEAASNSLFAAVSFMILTASRPSEAREAKWSEINLERRLWTVPAARMKRNREHQVPLSQAAIDILERQMARRKDLGDAVDPSDVVFSTRTGMPFTRSWMHTTLEKSGLKLGTLHGWRSLFRDFVGDRTSLDGEIAEAALAHRLGSKTKIAYRRGDALEKRRELMETYAAWLTGDSEAKVIMFARTG
jgi:integrase